MPMVRQIETQWLSEQAKAEEAADSQVPGGYGHQPKVTL
jgi:hypothetical protein